MTWKIIPSLLLGREGSYNLLGIPVTFIDQGHSLLYRVALGIFMAQYINVTGHEAGHSLAKRIVTGEFGDTFVESGGDGYCQSSKKGFLYRLYSMDISDIHEESPSHFCDSLFSFSGPLAESLLGLARSVFIRFVIRSTKRFSHLKNVQKVRVVSINILKFHNFFILLDPFARLTECIYRSIRSIKPNYFGSDFVSIQYSSGFPAVLVCTAILVAINRQSWKIMNSESLFPKKPMSFYEKFRRQVLEFTKQKTR